MDMITLLGLLAGIGGVMGGMIAEGGHVGSLIQGTAAVIVFAGTLGAVLVGNTKEDLETGLSLLKTAFGGSKQNEAKAVLEDLIDAAQIARRDSILALDRKLTQFENPFMRSVFKFVIDGVEPQVLRDMFEEQIALEEDNLMAGAKIYTDAGSYAPTIGIIGAVLGLIHVMSNLTDTSQLGSGIAVAFVATVYGVASANLLFLPLGNKIKRRIRKQTELKMMILEGALGILQGHNPFIIEEKLKCYLHEPKKASFNEAA